MKRQEGETLKHFRERKEDRDEKIWLIVKAIFWIAFFALGMITSIYDLNHRGL